MSIVFILLNSFLSGELVHLKETNVVVVTKGIAYLAVVALPWLRVKQCVHFRTLSVEHDLSEHTLNKFPVLFTCCIET